MNMFIFINCKLYREKRVTIGEYQMAQKYMECVNSLWRLVFSLNEYG